ncbi:hypothetical protein WR17_04470 [Escherichia coli]|nr:hypothetical protein RG46_03985 [Escherichia coli]KDV18009.1 hypothetical protein BW73_14800 [Escherichia coli O111:NM str. 01-3076]KDV45884.1 hypothetical protein BU53_14050 [Escherichia coli O91:H21 str. 2009C-3740]KIO38716.1 hypothetical protein SU67_22790 [Escherichia coli O139:H28 str. E24377A]APK82301.1 hypothetical protein RG51_20790 [Escherichia coli]
MTTCFYAGCGVNALSGLHLTAVVGLIRRASVASGVGCRMRRKRLIRPRFCYYHQISIWAPKVHSSLSPRPKLPPLKSAGTALP